MNSHSGSRGVSGSAAVAISGWEGLHSVVWAKSLRKSYDFICSQRISTKMGHLPSKLPFSKRRLRPRIVISYILDYVILVACIAGFYILDSIEPYHQHFSLNNISLMYPYAVHERVSIPLALCISGVAPLIIIAVYTLLIDGLFSHNKPVDPTSGKRKLTGPYRFKDRLWEFNCGFLGLLLSQGLAFLITQVLKNACGKPRPDIIDRCQPRPGSEDPFRGLSNYTICTGDPAIIKDGFRSWPSGMIQYFGTWPYFQDANTVYRTQQL
ncbi:hypothetical protein AO1008_09073 [Aspergillus oryzae 100-8]|uniref:Phosphatidic acid phosphatase type 2/haloperoxidase domain-containing protein n=1 Tax=Aspergillus oryzae (strain 3.042) TaxID=1160506 RepID=I7ZTE6_ASPO3|nr:hypothetical protein Ao3042_09166 [Aspergillus oryzae 3.042]KDE82792.1 hypothetical protein AO1008_09073 [Aspergillus oryzae 100-8]|eukprot:EIT75324.1 hypothetical protein Ao3042_09166 [Aspergillus oryzae 3.042]